MDEKELKALIEKGENQRIEFKQKPAEDIGKTICSFANTNDGIILVGVSDKKEIIGVSKKHEQQIANIAHTCKPATYPEIEETNVDGKAVFIVKVKKSDSLHSYKNVAYKRIGTHDKPLSPEEVIELAKKTGKIRWDEQVCEDACYDDTDKQTVNWFKKKYEKKFGKKIVSSDKELLKSIGCIKESKITNAGVLLFGKNPAKFFPRHYISIARYPGKDIGTAYLEIKDTTGNLFKIIDKAEKYIREHIETFHMLKKGQVAREPTPQYPDFVIRELIVNAVAHRDYSIIGSRILIKMFKDRIEFDSPGGFAGNVNEKNILYEQFSRNPTIVKVLNKAEYIEEMGEGWNRIVETIKDYPLKFGRMPEVKGNSRVVVTLFSPEEMPEKEPRKIDIKAVNEWLTKVDARLTQELSDKEKEILLFLLKNKKISSADCQKLLSISREMANRYFARLIERKLIVKVGAGKYTYYVIK